MIDYQVVARKTGQLRTIRIRIQPSSAPSHELKSSTLYSATPKEYQAFFDQISKMWADQPNWTDAARAGEFAT